jgi:ATP-binding cassette subfamily F protein 3
MIKLLLEPVNLLILDEPTNHLDMRTKDILKSALQDFDGTLILVSHDRDFLDGLVHKCMSLGTSRSKSIWATLKASFRKETRQPARTGTNEKIEVTLIC